jgi:hypothetical protein
MRNIRRSAAVFLAATWLWVWTPHSTEAQRLATDDPILQGIWDEAMNNSELESLAQALLDSIGPRRTVFTGRGGRPGEWPTCSLANRSSPDSGRR